MDHDIEQLKYRQAMPLGMKIAYTKTRMKAWYERYNGDIYGAFSGGKDSTVGMNILWEMYPDVPGVFANTGNELDSVVDFVRGYGDKVTWVKPKVTMDEIIAKYGYPVPSKEQAGFINELKRTNSESLARTRWFGNKWGRGKVADKWKKLLNAPFDVTHKCCNHLKIHPTSEYRKETDRKTMTFVMADESALRTQTYLRFGCNAFDMKDPTSRPMIFWTEADVLEYITVNKLPIASAYGKIEKGRCTGLQRTGCKNCLFGIDREKGENRIQRLARVEPEAYRHCIEDLRYDIVMDFIGVDWRPYRDFFIGQ